MAFGRSVSFGKLRKQTCQKQALRTSPTNRGSSLRYASGLPSAGAPILATKN
ncbi:MAG: hypothetical protein MR739_05075 [Spirochaetia bacterium]|nr:hypothetical protein [Spirochaetia bacterium]